MWLREAWDDAGSTRPMPHASGRVLASPRVTIRACGVTNHEGARRGADATTADVSHECRTPTGVPSAAAGAASAAVPLRAARGSGHVVLRGCAQHCPLAHGDPRPHH